MRYNFTYQVRGGLSFPVDMLRYDSSFPITEFDSGSMTIEQSVRHETEGMTVVQLGTWQDGRTWKPTAGRWKSFGWEVVPHSTTRIGR